ncbi:RcnB family protein [uncultured Pseudomonas sp.]|uniref:RcnB family protein n=1 Tax=uncultured Pseudomonas sp. TaxID=114707 RepID=UPI0025DE5922|nr:RcnB family protein [uncultured Pseudomonas sp.]
MKSIPLIAALTLAGALCGTRLAVAAQQTEAEPKGGALHPSELKVGEKAPADSDRESAAIDWKAKGLPEPEKESQWVQVKDKYVRVQITNNRIMEIVPVKK